MSELLGELDELIQSAWENRESVYYQNSDDLLQSTHFGIESSREGTFLLAAQWDLWDGDDQIVRIKIDLETAVDNPVYQRELLEVACQSLPPVLEDIERTFDFPEDIPDLPVWEGL